MAWRAPRARRDSDMTRKKHNREKFLYISGKDDHSIVTTVIAKQHDAASVRFTTSCFRTHAARLDKLQASRAGATRTENGRVAGALLLRSLETRKRNF